MTETIFREVLGEWHRATARLHHHQDQPALPSQPGHQGDTMNLTDIQHTIEDGIGNIEGWAADLKTHLPEIAAKAVQLDQSPIVAALEGVVLPPEDEQAIAAIIGRFAAAHAPVNTTQVQPAQAEPLPVTA